MTRRDQLLPGEAPRVRLAPWLPPTAQGKTQQRLKTEVRGERVRAGRCRVWLSGRHASTQATVHGCFLPGHAQGRNPATSRAALASAQLQNTRDIDNRNRIWGTLL